MPERDGYEPGVPCWADTSQPDPEAATGFYTDLFGWETEDTMPPDQPGRYFICRLRGGEVAGIGSQPAQGAPPVPVWNTYIWVESADRTAAKVKDAGGSVLMEPFDVLDAGRMAVLSDPAGAVFCVWQANQNKGARLVNEPGAMAWNELATRDPDGSKEFYAAVFGWEGSPMEDGEVEYTVWQLPGSENGIGGMIPMVGDQWPADLPPHWMVYFAVEDTDASAERVKALGGKVPVEPFETPAGRIAVVNDPHGAHFSIIKPTPQAQQSA
jgi:uncharacterized protein